MLTLAAGARPSLAATYSGSAAFEKLHFVPTAPLQPMRTNSLALATMPASNDVMLAPNAR